VATVDEQTAGLASGAAEQGFNIVHKLLGMTALGTAWVLWLLIALSVVSIAIMLERLVFFARLKLDMSAFTQELTKHLIDGNWDAARALCQGKTALEPQVVLRAIENRGKGTQAMRESMEGYLIGQRQVLDRGLVVLGTLGNNAPFIGLFGTVLGIIIAFRDLAENPAGGPSVVMQGISEALVATAVGLIVAIPAVIAFNAFNRVIKRHVANAETVMRLLLAHQGK
jgi:biopolymer transport protein ExbB